MHSCRELLDLQPHLKAKGINFYRKNFRQLANWEQRSLKVLDKNENSLIIIISALYLSLFYSPYFLTSAVFSSVQVQTNEWIAKLFNWLHCCYIYYWARVWNTQPSTFFAPFWRYVSSPLFHQTQLLCFIFTTELPHLLLKHANL